LKNKFFIKVLEYQVAFKDGTFWQAQGEKSTIFDCNSVLAMPFLILHFQFFIFCSYQVPAVPAVPVFSGSP
jgi:hypothetical protein